VELDIQINKFHPNPTESGADNKSTNQQINKSTNQQINIQIPGIKSIFAQFRKESGEPMLKFTKHNLKKIEDLFGELEYTIRYERGNFNAGYCIVENQRVAVINKYYDTEGRINCLLDILGSIEVDPSQLEEKSAKFYRQLQKLQDETDPEIEETEKS
jgi:hypothetical protein